MSLDRTEELLAANRALRESEERHARVLAATDEGIWDWNPATDEIFLSPRARQLFGISDGVEIRTRADVQQHGGFHPEDRRRVEETVYGCAARGSGGFELEYRVIDPAGKLRWIRSRAKAFPGGPGQPTRLTGSLSDITERKRAEVTLAESEARFRSLTEISADFFWETDAQHLCTAIEFGSAYRGSRALGAKLGKTRWEILPASPGEAEWNAHRAEIAAHRRFVNFGFSRIEDGEERFYEESGEPRFGPQGEFLGYRGIGRDITERKRAEADLRASEARFRSLTALSSDWYWEQDEHLRFTYLSSQASDLSGYPVESTIGKTRWEIPNTTPLASTWAEHQSVLAAHQPFRDLECSRVGPDGTLRYISMSGEPLFDEQGRFKGYHGTGRNITERKRIEEALRLSEERYALAVAGAADGIWDWDLATGMFYRSPRNQQITMGRPSDGIDVRHPDEWSQWFQLHPDDVPRRDAAIRLHLEGRTPLYEIEYRVRHQDGAYHWVQARGVCIRDASGRALRFAGSTSDIDARKAGEDALRLSEERYALAMQASEEGHFDWNVQSDEIFASAHLKIVLGLDADTQYRTRGEMVAHMPFHPEDRERIGKMTRDVLAGDALHNEFEYRLLRGPAPEERWIRARWKILRDAEGVAQRVIGVVSDFTERKRAEEGLRQSEERFALAVEGANEGIFDWDLVSDRAYVSYRAQELFGLPRGELWRPRRDWRHIVTFHPDDAPRLHASIKAHIEGRAPTYDEEFRIVVPGGGVRWFRQRGIALRDASGKAYRVVGSIGDVTEKHKAEEELSRLERQLRLAQRLEAMGTLAGGIAHDFNNILAAILGFSEMAWRDAPKGSRLQRDLESIATAGERGRALVDRILAFSRSGVGERVAVHVEQVVREALDLLSAKLPPSVTLRAELRAGRAAMLGDPTQVHQVLMNLGTNAVQAMPSGGILRVSLDAVRCEAARGATVGKVAAGDYVVLRVADSGSGIAPEILDRIFDPFFTTKEMGTGTGLGLSLVHGIVAELGGAIDLESTPGKGTTFTVHLPRTGDAADAGESEDAALPRGEGQRVLVVDDEETLVQLATRTLEDLGYRPVGFTSSAAALAAFCADPGRFDALIADERMPGLSGTALIREVRGVRRAIPILLMSGYVGGAVASLAREAGADDVLKKPVLARDLATSLARVLQP